MRPIDYAKELQAAGVIPPQAVQGVEAMIDQAIAVERRHLYELLDGICVSHDGSPDSETYVSGWGDCKISVIEALVAEFEARPLNWRKPE